MLNSIVTVTTVAIKMFLNINPPEKSYSCVQLMQSQSSIGH